jgi:two-component system chemotaxis response regulator CheB
MAKSIGVLVVDDSAFMRKTLTDILESDMDIKVIATAKDGLEALEKAKSFSPDVITLDVEMPAMDGLTCLKELQKITDAPVIMLSGVTKNGAKSTIEALEAGAIDFITKPAGLFDIAGEAKKKEIIEKILMARHIRNSSSKAIKEETARPIIHTDREIKRNTDLKSLITIGTSTGGPKALQEVIPFIPGDVPAAVVIVQHMPPGFTKSLADRLNTISDLFVKEAEDNEEIKPGYAYVAPGDFHLEIHRTPKNTLKIRLTQGPPVGGLRPAVNVMMNSIAATRFPNVIGVIMTGMGSDGSEGIVNIKNSNKGFIISQDEKSCVVYGMPKSAVNTGVVDAVVPLKEIAEVIVKYLGVDQVWT